MIISLVFSPYHRATLALESLTNTNTRLLFHFFCLHINSFAVQIWVFTLQASISVHHDLNSQFKLPLTPNCEGTGSWLRLQGIHFILSTWSVAVSRRLLLHSVISAHMWEHAVYPLVHPPTPTNPPPPWASRLRCGRRTLLPAYSLKTMLETQLLDGLTEGKWTRGKRFLTLVI